MTDAPTGGLPATEPASGKMSLRDAVRAGVKSVPQFNGKQETSPASDDLAAEEPSKSEAPAKAAPDAGSSAPEAPDAEPGGGVTQRPVKDHQDGQASQDPLAAPARWSEDWRKSFEALPEDAKRILLERDKFYNTGLTQNAQKSAESVRKLDAINGLFQDHHRREMQAAGYDESAAIRELLTRHDAFNRDPVGYGATVAKQLGKGDPSLYIAELIKRTGVTQQQLFPGSQQPTAQQPQTAQDEDQWVDPLEQKFNERYAEMQQRLDRYEQHFRQQEDRERQTEEQQKAAAQKAFYNEVAAFENAVNTDGTPKYPHMATVMDDVVRLVAHDPELQRNPLATLENAYNKAIRFHPDVSQQLMEEEFSRRLAARDAQAAAEKAKRAAGAKPSPGSTGGSVARGPMSIKEAARAAVAKHVHS